MLGFCALIYFCVDYTTNQITTLTSKKYKYCSEKIYLTKAVKVNIQKCILISKNVFLRNSSPKVFNTNFHKLLLQMTHAHVLYIVNNQGEFLVFNVVLFIFALVPLCLYKRIYNTLFKDEHLPIVHNV